MLGRIIHGWLFWKIIKTKFQIDYRKVVIVLSGENAEVDRQAITHLSDFMERKHVDKAIIFCAEQTKEKIKKEFEENSSILVETLGNDEMNLLYSFYMFTKFFDNIVFTNTDTPSDNMLGRYLKQTQVNEEDAVCLALYHLRQVPKTRG
ncbi:MAG: hypothetical protein J6I76_14330 [Oribacterium sp.]|nr:hypothetical protein [Oribacterium sp.]